MDVCLRRMRGGPLTQDLFLSICIKNMILVFLEFGKQRDHFRISIQTPLENPLMTIESFNKQFQIGEKERKAATLPYYGFEHQAKGTVIFPNQYFHKLILRGLRFLSNQILCGIIFLIRPSFQPSLCPGYRRATKIQVFLAFQKVCFFQSV